MKKIIGVIILLLVLIGAYFFLIQKEGPTTAEPLVVDGVVNEKALEVELKRVVLDVREFGGRDAVLVDGKATFNITDEDTPAQRGSVSYGDVFDVIAKGESADVYAVYYISGGGTGLFPYLFSFEYANGGLTQLGKVLLGDRIPVNEVHIEQTEPNNYQVWVEIVEREPLQGMTAEPAISQVLHFFRTPSGLMLGDIAYGTLESHDIGITEPLPFAELVGDITVRGEAIGPWYFEATFPLELRTTKGVVVAQSFVTAQGSWMTTDLVPFEGLITAPSSASGLHILRFKKANASGLPEHDGFVDVPVVLQ